MEIIPRRPYRHFKGNLYYVHDIVSHTETGETMVTYQALYEPFGMFVRPLEMFMEKVPDNVTGQTFRFELYKGR